jgi:hypothetical protein
MLACVFERFTERARQVVTAGGERIAGASFQSVPVIEDE